jgi:hypothetical protein
LFYRRKERLNIKKRRIKFGAFVVKKRRFNHKNTKKRKPPKHEKKCIPVDLI